MTKSREEKGLDLIIAGKVRQLTPYRFAVIGTPNKKTGKTPSYTVDLSHSAPRCSCADTQYRDVTCKHAHAAIFYKSLTNEIDRFLNVRSDITAQDIVTRGLSLDATPTAQALGVIAGMMEEQRKPKRLAFKLRYTWADGHPENMLDSTNLVLYADAAIDILVQKPGENFRKTAGSLQSIIEHIEAYDMEIGRPELVTTFDNGDYIIPVYCNVAA